MTSRVEANSPLATAESVAASKFEAWPEAVNAVGSGPEFLATLTDKVNPIVVGLSVLKYDDEALTERWRSAGDDTLEAALATAQYLGTQASAFRALASWCETAEVRTMVVLSRLALERGV